jgi:phage terminase large subunit
LAVDLHPKFKELFNTNSRYFVLTGGRGSGKSFAVSASIATLSFLEKMRVLYTRYTMTSAHLSVIPEFYDKLNVLGVAPLFEQRKTELVNIKTGSVIDFRGLKTSSGDQTANLKSLANFNNWILDEAEELTDEKKFDDIAYSFRDKSSQNRIILMLNPSTKEHWIYKRFFESRGVQDGFCGTVGNTTYIHTTYLDNLKNLSEDFIKDVEELKINNPTKYNHIILGGWLDKAEGVVFTNWEFGEFNPNNLQTSFGLDYGFSIDPTALIEVAINKPKREIYLKEHFYGGQRLGYTDLAKILLDRAGRKLIIADSAEPRLNDELVRQGLNLRPISKTKIQEGVTLMQDYKLIISKESTNLAKELNNYRYADKGSNLYIDNFNHGIDASRYNITNQLINQFKPDIR